MRHAMVDDLTELIRRFGRQGVLVMDLYSPFGQGFPPGWVQVRQLLLEAARDSGVRAIPGSATAINGRPQFLAPDGLHPNDAGHQALASAVQPGLKLALA